MMEEERSADDIGSNLGKEMRDILTALEALYVITMSHMSFRVNQHSIVA